MRTRRLGPFTVSAIGYGALQLSSETVAPVLSRSEAMATVHAALDAGITLVDTADCYAPTWDTMGHNEELIGAALRAYGPDADRVVVATKAGITRDADGWGRNASPRYLRDAVELSLSRLGVDVIDLYQWHRPDPPRPYADAVRVFAELRDEGKIRAVGISNANLDEIRIAMDVLGPGGLASVQNEFSPRFLSSRGELELCGRHGVAFLPWSPLGGAREAAEVGSRFDVFARIGADRDVSPQRVVLAWHLALGDHVIPIPGARRAASIVDSAGAADLDLTADELAAIASALG